MKRFKFVAIMILIVVLMATLLSCLCTVANRQIYPEDGIWYCDELQLYINFGFNQTSKAIIDGEEIQCEANHMGDSLNITVVRLYDESTPENRVLFPGEYVSLKDNELVLRHRDTRVEYTFVRIE